ncbi:DUF485 domain-containing protein [Salinibacterium sp. ZJ77]|uniref:DUF485 domain-containing protein n=1 Tax=Salinibacterium sp. ZJ77 TaxID=2708337 RepID=UPI001423F48B|nr:DUF485 domain-containing protein [Salinibacterium sp. ZJ77]
MTDAPDLDVEAPRPTRVRVTAPRAGTEPPVPAPTTEASDPSALYIRSLIRSQRRLGIVCAVAFGVVLMAVPTVFTLLPWLDEARVGAVPASWIVLGAGLFPVILAIAALYERAANRNEARYRSLADDADDDA